MSSCSIAVVIPVRNRPQIIARAIAAAAAQTHPVSEIIVVDDASTDNTPACVAALAARDPRIRLVTLPQRVGAPLARNHGAAAATSDLLAFLDSDDGWRPTKLARQVALLNAIPDAPAAFTAISYRYPDRPAYDSKPPSVVNLPDLFPCNVLGTCSTALVRRSAFERIGGFIPDLPSCQDWELWLRLAELGPLPVATEPLTDYFYDDAGRISRSTAAVLDGHRKVHGMILARIANPARRRAIEVEHLRGLAVLLSRRTYAPAQALSHAAAALRARPDAANARLLAETALRVALEPLVLPAFRALRQGTRPRSTAIPSAGAPETELARANRS